MSNGTPPPPPPPAPAPQAPAPSYSPPPNPGGASSQGGSGMPLWAKIGIGCGCVTAIIVAVLLYGLVWGAKKAVNMAQDFEKNPAKAVEALIELNPKLDVVENDPATGRITVRDTSTGEESTFDYSDVKEGRLSFEGDQGSFSVDTNDGEGLVISTPEGEAKLGNDLSDVPPWVPTYPDLSGTDQGGMTSVQGETASGMMGGKTADSLEVVEAWYQKKLESNGFTVERNTMSFGDQRQIILNAKKEGIDQLTVAIGSGQGDDQTQVAVTYSGPKQ